MSTCIFVRSFNKDFAWLSYALRSIQKFATGFSEVIIAVPEGQEHGLKHLTAETVITVHDGQPGYLCQQLDKLNADKHTQAQYLLHWDSDMSMTAPITPEFFFKDGKPIWVVTPWGSLPGHAEKKAWFHVCAKALQECPPYEYMRKCAIIAPRWIYASFRQHMANLHGMPLDAYIMNQPGHEFSEYSTLGFFAWLYHREAFHWHDTSVDGVPNWPFKQYWSYGGITPEIRQEIEAITA